MAEEKVEIIVKFFAKPGVAALEITDGTLSVGDRIRIKGHTTDFQDTITSMQEENNPVEKAVPGQMIGIKVKDRVREHDIVYVVS
jgi:putative protease